ncbi:MAG: hypothetical protein EAZ55_12470 [Cytophagales bacterium]|nr:MAG: hypothetical protein EAZ55_12470 [Cytophagales bacterium]
MKKTILLLCSLMLGFGLSWAQKRDCKCQQDFDFIISYVEKNHPGFADNVTPENRQKYESYIADIQKQINEHPNPDVYCLMFLRQYLNYIYDNHLQIGADNIGIDEKNADLVAQFKASPLFQQCERVSVDSAQIYQYLSQSKDPIEGIYDDGVYRVAVLKNQTAWRDYYGVILDAKTSLWERGQVKLEIKKRTDDFYDLWLYLRNHNLQYRNSLRNNKSSLLVKQMLGNSQKIFPIVGEEVVSNYYQAPDGDWFQFKELNDSTCYVHIKSFDGSLASKFDSAYKVILPIITQKPYLIVDVRDNGGGSDRNWQELGKLTYTNPYPASTTYVYCTADIITRYKEVVAEVKANEADYGKGLAKYFEKRIEKMQKQPEQSFYPLSDEKKVVIAGGGSKTPQKIVVLFNRYSASAAEGFILHAANSKKTILMGENSGGYIAYGNLFPLKTPNGYTFYCTTQKTPSRLQYEIVGIPPQVYAQNNEDWIVQALKLLNK